MKKPEPARSAKIALLSALAALFLALLLARDGRLAERTQNASEPVPDAASSAPLRRVRKAAPRGAATRPTAAGACVPGAFFRCHEGDVWSEDSCGNLESQVEECELQLCRDAACEEPDAEPCTEPSEGRCDGQVVRLCQAGRAQSIDCAARGLRCLQGEEGAECGPLLSAEERCSGPVRCEGDTLVACLGGRRERVDCALLAGRCEALTPAEPARCVQHKLALSPGAECAACGCPPSGQGERACDGRDDDGDRHVDEGLSCGPVPIIAFVIADAGGDSSFSRAEIEAEIAHANALLESQSDEPALAFALSELIVVPAPSMLELSERAFRDAAFDARFHPVRPAFYVPLVFADHLFAQGEVPRIGASTLPNGFCGGVQRGRAPPVGIIGIAKARASTTLLHELGHFLGLCHTHDQTFGLQTVSDDPARAAALLCDERCNHEGDGLCDTPLDPGPEGCRYDAACRTLCQRGETPDAKNLMSYYTPCRERFSPGQRRTIEHTLALRRAWHPCLSGECPCVLGADECPQGMACRPTSDALGNGRCVLSGPRAPGAQCEAHAQCALGLCLGESKGQSSRCARPCLASAPGCTCSETNLNVSMCREDLAP